MDEETESEPLALINLPAIVLGRNVRVSVIFGRQNSTNIWEEQQRKNVRPTKSSDSKRGTRGTSISAAQFSPTKKSASNEETEVNSKSSDS